MAQTDETPEEVVEPSVDAAAVEPSDDAARIAALEVELAALKLAVMASIPVQFGGSCRDDFTRNTQLVAWASE